VAGKHEKPCLGELAPRYGFFLNPYSDVRFVTCCPNCGRPPRQRKLPLAVHVDDWGMVVLNKTCRFCPVCELLIANRDELESLLANLFQRLAPAVIGSHYFVVGTVERQGWRRGLTNPLAVSELRAVLHDFKDHHFFEPPQRWVRAGPGDGAAKPR